MRTNDIFTATYSPGSDPLRPLLGLDRAKAAGLRVNMFFSDDPDEAEKFLGMGIDTILTNDYQPLSSSTGLR